MDATVSLRRCLLLYGEWLSHSAYDAKMVNIAVGIVLESVNHDMPGFSIKIQFQTLCYYRSRFVGSKHPVRGESRRKLWTCSKI